MRFSFKHTRYSAVDTDALAVPLFDDDRPNQKFLKDLDRATGGLVGSVFASGEVKSRLHHRCIVHRPQGMAAKRLLLVGASSRAAFTPALLRESVAAAVRAARSAGATRVAYLERSDTPVGEGCRIAAEGALYGEFDCDAYKTRDREGRNLDEFVLLGSRRAEAGVSDEGFRRGAIVGEAVNLARTLANEPANVLTPSALAERAAAAGRDAGLAVEVLERDEMEKLGMNALLAVARGSAEAPKLIVLRIRGQERGKGPLHAMIGKGVTFDSGGISIKPADKMEDMKADMSGGAAVLAAMLALGRLGTRKRVMGLIPAVENLPGGGATRPGDVVKSHLGKTVEIINTDAEGRLIMADALSYARRLGASSLIDIATLTGACVVALGHVNAGMMGTDRKTIDRLRRNCRVTGEKLWQLPLDDEYRQLIISEIADMKNLGNRYGGAITAAKFLQEFAEDTPWVHLDIAGVDLDHDGKPFAAKGATGFGVRTLVQLFA